MDSMRSSAKIQITLRLPYKLKNRLQRMSGIMGESMNNSIIEAIDKYVDDWESSNCVMCGKPYGASDCKHGRKKH